MPTVTQLPVANGKHTRVSLVAGFGVYNPTHLPWPCFVGEDSEVHATYASAKKERDDLAREYDNPELEVVAVCLLPRKEHKP